MTRSRARSLATEYCRMLREDDPVMVFTTADLHDNPHSAIVSDVVVTSPERLVVMLDQHTQSFNNLQQNPRVAIAVLGDGLLLSIKGLARVFKEQLLIEVTIDSVSDQVISHPHFPRSA